MKNTNNSKSYLSPSGRYWGSLSHLRSFVAIFTTLLLLSSCGEVYDLNGFDWEEEIPLNDSVYNREIQILDLGNDNIPASHRPLDGDDPLFFSLGSFSSVHLGYRISNRWDIAFSGISRSSFSTNNGSISNTLIDFSPGSTAIGGLCLLDSAYSQVVTVPDDGQFNANLSSGLAGMGDNLTGATGHLYYTFFKNIFLPEKTANLDSDDPAVYADANSYQHLVYPLIESTAAAFPGEYGPAKYKVETKTLIIKTAKGDYAKLEIQSYYKGVLDPLLMKNGTDTPVPYISFRYMLIKADEKRYGFIARREPLTVNLTTKKVTVGE